MENNTRMFTVDQVHEQSFYQIPKHIHINPKYKGLSAGAILTYGLLKDRQELSIKNNWIDEGGNVFLYFDCDKLGEMLNFSRKSIVKFKKELEECDLLRQKRQGQGKPNKIYVMHVESYVQEKEATETPINSECEVSTQQEVSKSNSSKTEYNKTEYIKDLHHPSDDDGFLKLLNDYCQKRFNKPIRKFKERPDLDEIEDLTTQELKNFLDKNIKDYRECNVDYLNAIKHRARMVFDE